MKQLNANRCRLRIRQPDWCDGTEEPSHWNDKQITWVKNSVVLFEGITKVFIHKAMSYTLHVYLNKSDLMYLHSVQWKAGRRGRGLCKKHFWRLQRRFLLNDVLFVSCVQMMWNLGLLVAAALVLGEYFVYQIKTASCSFLQLPISLTANGVLYLSRKSELELRTMSYLSWQRLEVGKAGWTHLLSIIFYRNASFIAACL